MSEIPTKWAYIAEQLAKHNAPKEVIDAALSVDLKLNRHSLIEPTEDWIMYPKKEYLPLFNLSGLVLNKCTCSGCSFYDDCFFCPISYKNKVCMKEVFIVSKWVKTKAEYERLTRWRL